MAISSIQAEKAVRLARKHVGNGAEMESSARLCLSAAVSRLNEYQYDSAHWHACRSLRYSVGVFSADYQTAVGTRDMFSVERC
jgi:hypothetical protein